MVFTLNQKISIRLGLLGLDKIIISKKISLLKAYCRVYSFVFGILIQNMPINSNILKMEIKWDTYS